MTRLIDADALKESIDEHVYLVTHGFNETEYGCTQYGIHQIIDDAPTIDAVPLDGSFKKMSKGDYLIYNRHWLYEHFDQEIDIQRSAMKSMGYEYVGKNTDTVRHGKWITEECLPGVAVCSICGHEIRGIGCQYTNYCDECGARMDEE